ncbi:uncharacterized protein METZ01_LOCUS436621, partial [marine metagenome]
GTASAWVLPYSVLVLYLVCRQRAASLSARIARPTPIGFSR